ncbi:MAG: folate-binding protein YgfZ [Gammaproteobacteria bacterium]|nr:folate-binding protein YgfZ [Gammaproteobacteria bacterium]
MKPEWKDFLSDAGAEFAADGSVESFGNPNRELQVSPAGEVICDLSHLGLISAHGDDARSFLQGQFSNDIHQVDPTHSQLSAYHTAKGRMLALMRIFQRDQGLYLELPRDLLEDTLKRLRMFVLRSKVTLDDASDAFVRIGLAGPRAEERLHAAVGPFPSDPGKVCQVKGITVLRLSGVKPRFEICGELDDIKRIWDELNVDCAPVGAPVWKLLNILAGVPTLYAVNREAFVAQMANLDRLGGISFTKGCYTGQEIVARMHYLGQLKQRMFAAVVKADAKPGDELFADDQATGKVIDAAPHQEGGHALLGVMRVAAREADDVRLGSADGPRLNFIELPYPLQD